VHTGDRAIWMIDTAVAGAWTHLLDPGDVHISQADVEGRRRVGPAHGRQAAAQPAVLSIMSDCLNRSAAGPNPCFTLQGYHPIEDGREAMISLRLYG
jgi:hypothetical protein